jgi:nitroreductase
MDAIPLRPDREASAEHPIEAVFRRRWSPRSFEDRPVSAEELRTVLEAARWASSSNNLQPWRYLITRRHEEPAAFARLLGCLSAGNQAWAGRAPVLMLSVARVVNANGNANRHAWHDTGQASAALSLQAAALGLQVHQMGGFDAARAREVFEIPDGFDPVAAIALGYPGSPDALEEPQRSRETAPRTRRTIGGFAFGAAWGAAL